MSKCFSQVFFLRLSSCALPNGKFAVLSLNTQLRVHKERNGCKQKFSFRKVKR